MNDVTAVSESKSRIVQELVPGKQITLAHIIAGPDPVIYTKLGLNPDINYDRSAIGILSISPAEVAVIAADIATKKADIDLGFVDRFSGTLIITGLYSDVHSAITAIMDYARDNLGFALCNLTKT